MKWYKYDIRDLTDKEYEKWYALMSDDKKNRIDKACKIDDKKRSVVGEMLSRKAIAKWCGVTPESIVFINGKHGKPFAKDLNIEFNISHSENLVVCAINDKPIGIDVEQICPIDLKIAKKICTTNELIYLFGRLPNEQDFSYNTDKRILTRFFKLWTAKEAYGKLIGDGLASMNIEIDKPIYSKIIKKEYIVSIIT